MADLRSSVNNNEVDRHRMARVRAHRSQQQRARENEIDRFRRRNAPVNLERGAFSYDPEINYSGDKSVKIGEMSIICQHCKALKYSGESAGLCCAGGKVKLPQLVPPPDPLHSLVFGMENDSKHFLANIQKYNNCFQMTSFGATHIVQNSFMPTFKIQGQIHHLLGALLPVPDADHQFLQIYFMGNQDAEVDRRCAHNPTVKRTIVQQLQTFLHQNNDLVKVFKMALDRMPSDSHNIVIRADKTPVGEHARRFNSPTIDEVAIVVVGENLQSRDIVLHRRNNELKRVSETHRAYDALQYPLIFWKAEDGYHFNIKMVNPTTGAETNKKVSAMNFYSYRLMIREGEVNHILMCQRLFHQFAVDMYVKIETERLTYIRLNQQQLRSEEYIHLRDAINADGNANNVGKMTILPATYIGSPRHMHEYAQDAMSYVRKYGRPDLFITFTCNPEWIEIKKELLHGQTPLDRHDITARVFKQKLKSLMNFIIKHRVYGQVRCWMYSVEWQKRGLPHAHILVWLVDKIRPEEIDSIISAEIPDETVDPKLHAVVTKHMIHGPCGVFNNNSPCMVDGKCSKRYPRELIAETITGNDGYPLYRRRSVADGGRSVVVKIKGQDFHVDNRWIVPYSPILSKTFEAHINVEFCNSVKSIKYICKYVNKGSDMAVFAVTNTNDEVSQYQMGRYVSSNEAIWRIFSFAIHERHPTVVHLAVHLENGQRVYFNPRNAVDRASRPPSTTLTSFFSICQTDDFARTLLYADMPRYYTWNASSKSFQRRKQGTPLEGHPNVFVTDAIGRIYTVHPNNDECYYLRLLLVNVRGPTSFQQLRTVDGHLCATYREACQLLQLLEDDSHWDNTLKDSIISTSPHQIRTLFAIIISTCFPSNPEDLWMKYRDDMSEDVLHRVRCQTLNPTLQITAEIYNETLIMIEDMCLMMANKVLSCLGLTAPNRSMQDAFNHELRREQQYDTEALTETVRTTVPQLNEQQRITYDSLIQAVNSGSGGIYFLDAPGGTGKTFLISLLLAKIRSQNEVALALASSGIAATLLEGGRTAHSALKLPLNMQINETPVCNIAKNSAIAKILQICKLIIWDECTMAHKRSLEALDRTLKDLRDNQNIFGGAMILLSGDFRQTLPVIPRSTVADELNACLKSSYLWRHVKTLQLTTNMRVLLQQDQTAIVFSKQLLDIGNGKVTVDTSTGLITFPTDFCHFTDSKEELIQRVFPDIKQLYNNHNWLSERAILAAKNKDVDDLNATIQNFLPGELFTYKSVDTATNQDDVVNYPTEFLNSLELPGLPPHNLQLKVGSVVIMLRNINQPRLCNGTRLAVKKLMNNVIEAKIIKGKYKGEDVLIPRIPMIPTDLPFDFKRLQFPVRLAFAMTINKSQGQSLQICGINLEFPCFAHGQLYVACSRVGKPSSLYIYAPQKKTKNIVYQKALN
ncbi:uncharacterized protein isoform X1 [Choristoneura fumiferana]|uniref:uncharacterized protein isoform X1 n=1 Tax=Choristoneura fumiferana TaxID=7141 RepID=UPI003D157DAB